MKPGFVQIIHPELGPDQVAEVPASSLAEWFASGWHRLAADEVPAAAAEGEPAPMTRAQAAGAARRAAPTGTSEEK